MQNLLTLTCMLSNSWQYVSKIPINAKKKGVLNASKQCPSSVQACPNTSFSCPSLENTLAEILQFTAWPRPSFPTNWPFYNIKRRDDSHASASKPQASGRRARVSPFLEFYLRLVRCWLVPHFKSRQNGMLQKRRKNLQNLCESAYFDETFIGEVLK